LGKWLEANCALNERTAQRYMEIAKGEATLRAKVTSDTMSELTLKKAKQLITAGKTGAGTNSGTCTSPGTSDAYDAVEGKLIKKLEQISSPDTAQAAAQETINKLVGMVRIKNGGKHSLKLPAA
jgi:archaellum component FlaG (FlaF/FlaG flagellin family)